MDKEYVVTLHRKEDLEQFYNEMQLSNFPLARKRPISRNTHYMMTEEQAERLRQDPRVWDVVEADSMQVRPKVINNEPTTISGEFWKDSPFVNTSFSGLVGNKQWGQLHCAGDQVQRRKNLWGDGTGTEYATDTVEIHNNGRHVDVVIVDDPVSYDSKEWESPSQPGVSRFVQYQWFNELNSAVIGLNDLDGQTPPSGTITYGTNASTPQYHGNHVTGTVAGQFYGWASEANIYNLAVTDAWQSGQQINAYLIFDYLRAFHLNKPINPATGKRNPTITNHSYGGIHDVNTPSGFLLFSDLSYVNYRGVQYNASNPGPSGWTQAGVEADFGVRFGGGTDYYPSYNSAVAADVQDAIDDGVVVIGAAGNDNLLIATPSTDSTADWNNFLVYVDSSSILRGVYYNRGAWPITPDTDAIIVGALSDHSQFRRSTYTMFGPGVDIFAPGDFILSAYGNTGYADTKYGAGNYYNAINGTSMASPQVCGVIACLATGKERFTQADAIGFLDKHSIYGDMTFDISGGGLADNTCRQGSPNKYLHIENPRSIVGYIQEQKGRRTTGLTFPRSSAFHSTSPGPQSQTFTLSVRNDSSSDWRWVSGTDRSGVVFDDSPTYDDWTLQFYAGDVIQITNNAGSIHPFWIKTTATTGTGDAVTTGTITGNGASLGTTVEWDTTGVAPGRYYYVCSNHSGMQGQIMIS